MMHSTKLPDLKGVSDLFVVDRDGNDHMLGRFWEERRVVMVFIRHFG